MVNKMKVLILEDEEYTLRFLEKLISEHPLVKQVVGTSNSIEAINLAKALSPDVAFLDIELKPQDAFNGIEVASNINSINPSTKFIFVSGYSKYAIDSFAVHPYDYVLKPIQKAKIFDVLSELGKDIPQNRFQTNANQRLVFRSDEEIFFVNTDDVYFFEKLGKKAFIHTKNGIREATCIFNELETILGSQFKRVHKSFVINMEKISYIRDTGNQSYEVHFHDYSGVALMSRNKFRENQMLFSPSL